jgi:CDP-diglyceride synthetase
LWHLYDSFGPYAGLKFDQHCFDATLALAIALNKTIEGIHTSAVCSVLLINVIVLLDLSTDQMFSDIARQQAGLRNEMGFQITDFNYSVSVIPNRTKLHLGDVCFDGLSVYTQELISNSNEVSVSHSGSGSI